jgi:ribose/xylose/arabinose/galactoside ABC-type transport system permease subunit
VVPEIATVEVWQNILSDMMPLLIVCLGQTIVLIVAASICPSRRLSLSPA